jgi:LPS O-antigen subunit length determinant protein (WzzB/FepE family)
MIERVWIIVSGLLLIAAAIFLWRNNLSAAFVIAALGVCAWFLSYRAQLRELIPDEEDSSEEPEVRTGNRSDRIEERENED